MFSDHNGIKLKINNRNITGKTHSAQRLNNTFLITLGQIRHLKKNVKYFELNKSENTAYQNL